MSTLQLHEVVAGGPTGDRPRQRGTERLGRRARVRRSLSDVVIAVAVAVFLCSAVALRVLDSVPLAVAGLPLGLGLLWISRAVDPPFAAWRPARRADSDEGETAPLPAAAVGSKEHRSAA